MGSAPRSDPAQVEPANKISHSTRPARAPDTFIPTDTSIPADAGDLRTPWRAVLLAPLTEEEMEIQEVTWLSEFTRGENGTVSSNLDLPTSDFSSSPPNHRRKLLPDAPPLPWHPFGREAAQEREAPGARSPEPQFTVCEIQTWLPSARVHGHI